MSRGGLAGLRMETRRALRGLAQAPGFAAGVVLVMGVAVAGTVIVATAAREVEIIGVANAAKYGSPDEQADHTPADPATWLMTGAILAVVVLAAGLSPARRAARIQPTAALRFE